MFIVFLLLDKLPFSISFNICVDKFHPIFCYGYHWPFSMSPSSYIYVCIENVKISEYRMTWQCNHIDQTHLIDVKTWSIFRLSCPKFYIYLTLFRPSPFMRSFRWARYLGDSGYLFNLWNWHFSGIGKFKIFSFAIKFHIQTNRQWRTNRKMFKYS